MSWVPMDTGGLVFNKTQTSQSASQPDVRLTPTSRHRQWSKHRTASLAACCARSLMISGPEGVENLEADRPGSGAPGTLRGRCSVFECRNNCGRRVRVYNDAILAHAPMVFLQPGRERQPQGGLGLAAGAIIGAEGPYGDGCLTYQAVYDAYGRYAGQREVYIC